MNFLVVGTNHKYSPIALREKISFSKKRLKDALSLLKEEGVLKGAVILSTCNRVEIYASAEDSKGVIGSVKDFISRYHEMDKRKFLPYLYIYEGKEAVRHLFSVACGLDSLILGETQILNQVKFSVSEAFSIGFTDRLLDKMFCSAVSFAKRIHTKTRISEGKVSIGSVAIDFAKEKIGALQGKNILVIGVGKVTELVLKYFKKEKPNVVLISNRTFEKAKELAVQMGAEAVRFDEIRRLLEEADVVITATASPHFVIKRETLEKVRGRRLLIIDLALPRDVDPRVKEIKNIDLFCLEDLDSVIKKNVERKTQEAKKVKAIIDIEIERLWSRMLNYEEEVSSPKAVSQEEFLRDPEESFRREAVFWVRPRSVTNEITSFKKKIYKIGTRSSPLALRQVQEVLAALKKLYPVLETEIIEIDTYGDKDKVTSISQIEGSDFFTREIDEALLKGEIDFAVHSAKDLPENLREGLVIAAVTSSIAPYDVLVSKSELELNALPYGAKIGTSSLRRKQQLKKYRDDFQIVDIRGNIEERLRKLDRSDLDALVIAAAGLLRLGLENRISQRIPFEILRPHPLQGSLALVARSRDFRLINLLSAINSRETVSV